MNIITRTNQKTLIFLKKEANFVLASIVLLSYEASGKVTRQLLGTQKISTAQFSELKAKQSNLLENNVYLIDVEENPQSAVLLLEGITGVFDLENGKLIPSPYFQILINELLFLSTQKTRGPNFQY